MVKNKKNKIVKKKEEKKDFKPLILFFVFEFLIILVFAFVLALFNPTTANVNDSIAVTIISGYILTVVLTIMYRKKLINDVKKINLKTLILIIISTAVIMAFSTFLEFIFEKLNIPMSNEDNVRGSILLYPIIMKLYTIIVAPITEEMAFRYSLGTIFKNKKLFIIVSGIVFGVLHSTNLSFILYAIVGSALAAIYLKTNKNIACTIIIHAINNAVSVLISTILLLNI